MCETHRNIVWGYQKHFVASVQRCAEKLFDAILAVRPIVAGVIAWGEDEAGTAKAVATDLKEETLPTIDVLAGLDAATAECKQIDPRKDVFQSHPVAQERDDRALHFRSRQCAVSNLLNKHTQLEPARWFASAPATVERWQVSVVLAIQLDALAGPQVLPDYVTERGFKAERSYTESLLEVFLGECRIALLSYGGNTDGLWPEKYDEWRRDAADNFIRGAIVSRTGHGFALTDMLAAINRLSAEAYEREHAAGTMVMAHPKHPALVHAVKFIQSVDLGNTRAARKLLQMSGESVCLLANAEKIEGLCTLDSAREVEHHADFKSVFKIVFNGHFRWQVQHGDNVLLRMAYGSPTFPRPKVAFEGFHDTYARVFPDATTEQAKVVWGYVQTCIEQRHGTMLALVEGAQGESQRLAGQSTAIEPKRLDKDVLLTASAIDGAILTDAAGTCFAFGTILDGVAVEGGNPARGARFNSAVRYIAGRRAAGQGCMCVVVSEDGSVDVLPKLKPRMDRKKLELAIAAFETICAKKPLHHGEAQGMRFNFDELRSYLTPDYAARINAAWKLVEEAPNEEEEIGSFRLAFEPLVGVEVPDDMWTI